MKIDYIMHTIPDSDLEFWAEFNDLLSKDAELVDCDLGQFSGIDTYYYRYKGYNFTLCFESKGLFAVGGY